MARTIAIANQKGGVGKTTTCANLAAGLAELEQCVLAIDLDPQGNLSTCLGIDIESLDTTVYDALLDNSVAFKDILQKTDYSMLDLAPSNIDLSAAEVQLINELGREKVLSEAIKEIEDNYDFIIIDCPPSLGFLTLNGLVAADEVIVPVNCSYLAVRGLAQLMQTVEKVKTRMNHGLEISGVLLTRYDPRTLHAKEVADLLKKRFGDKVFKTIIAQTVRFDEAPVAGTPILKYDSTSKGAQAYRELAREVLNG